TWALINVPNPDVPLGSGVVGRIAPALSAAAPAGVSVSVTGFEQIQTAGGGGGGGPSVLIETLIAGAGALAVLLFVYGSAIAVAASVTLLPVILASWGPALDKHRVVRSGSTTFSRRWESWGKMIVRRRWIAGILGLAIVLGLAIPALSMNTGQPRANALGGTG